MGEEGEFQEGKVSKYNSGIAQIFRLDNLWKDTHRHSRLGQLELWNWDLDRVWCELAGDLEEDDERINKFNTINKDIADLKDKLRKKLYKRVDEYNGELYRILTEKDLFLRRLQNKLGKGSSWDDGTDDSWE